MRKKNSYPNRQIPANYQKQLNKKPYQEISFGTLSIPCGHSNLNSIFSFFTWISSLGPSNSNQLLNNVSKQIEKHFSLTFTTKSSRYLDNTYSDTTSSINDEKSEEHDIDEEFCK